MALKHRFDKGDHVYFFKGDAGCDLSDGTVVSINYFGPGDIWYEVYTGDPKYLYKKQETSLFGSRKEALDFERMRLELIIDDFKRRLDKVMTQLKEEE